MMRLRPSSARCSPPPSPQCRWLGRLLLAGASVVLVAGAAAGQEAELPAPTPANQPGLFIPDVSRVLPPADSPETLTNSLQIVVLLTVLTVAPSILLMTTCFVRILVVLGLLQRALGTQSLPPAQVITALSLILTFLVMAPVGARINERALQPYINGQMGQLDALGIAVEELRDFMFDQIEAAGNEEDVYLMVEYADQTSLAPEATLTRGEVPTVALVPAFVLSELKTAFIIGFKIYLPFLVIDMVIATILVSMGMMMLPPVLISLPFKLLLFVLADGWHLIVGSLMNSIAT